MTSTRTATGKRDPRSIKRGQELRVASLAPASLRAGEPADDGSIPFKGVAIRFNEWTEIPDFWFGSFQERFDPAAVVETIGADDIRLLINHDPNLVLARSQAGAGTLRLASNAQGLNVEADMAPTSYARDLALSLARGDISQMSFAFEALEEEWEDRPDGVWMRTVTKARLYDVSPVTYAAYPTTEAGLRSLRGRLWRNRERALLPGLRAGKRNSSADEDVIRSAVDTVRGAANDLEALIETADGEGERARRRRTKRAGAQGEKRSEAGDAATLAATIESLKGYSAELDDIAADLNEALDAITDPDTISAIQNAATRSTGLSDELVDLATDLATLLGNELDEGDEEEEEGDEMMAMRAARVAQERRRHEAFASRYGMRQPA